MERFNKYLTKCPDCNFKAFLINRVIECPDCGCEIEDTFKVKSDRELIKEEFGIDLDEVDNFDEDSIGLTDSNSVNANDLVQDSSMLFQGKTSNWGY